MWLVLLPPLVLLLPLSQSSIGMFRTKASADDLGLIDFAAGLLQKRPPAAPLC